MIKRPTVGSVPSSQCRDALLRVCLAMPGTLTAEMLDDALIRASAEDLGPMRGITSLIVAMAHVSDLRTKHPLMRQWHALALREDRRCRLIETQMNEFAKAAEALRIEPLMLRGPRLAAAVYPDPHARHSHALRYLLSSEADRTVLAEALGALGWTTQRPQSRDNPHFLTFEGHQRVELALYNRLFAWTHPIAKPLEGDLLSAIDILGAAQTEFHARSYRWVCDLVFLLRKKTIASDDLTKEIDHLGFAASAQINLAMIQSLIPPDCTARPQLDQLQTGLKGRRNSSRFVRFQTRRKLERRLGRRTAPYRLWFNRNIP